MLVLPPKLKTLYRVTILALVVSASGSWCAAAADDSPDGKQYATVAAFPARIDFRGADSRQQLLVTGTTSNDRRDDLTRMALYVSGDPSVVSISPDGVVLPVGSGKTEIAVSFGHHRMAVPVDVRDGDKYLPPHFANDIVPIFTKLGCNGGGCHGKSGGRGGFALSLFGYVPNLDFESITKGARGRRVFPADPDRSLLLMKPTNSVPHGGGRRLEIGQPEYDRLVRWIQMDMPRGLANAPQVEHLEIEPQLRAMSPKQQQQLVAIAVFSDGSRRDVTRVTEFKANDSSIANVDERGRVTAATRNGETAIVAKFQGQIAVSRIVRPRMGEEVRWTEFPIRNVIDQHIAEKLKSLRIPPSPIADDATFLRRVSLQVIGKIPSADEVRNFVADTAPNKRDKLVTKLLNSGEYADYFAQKWSDVLRNKRRGQKDRIAETIAFHRWIRNAIATNMPYDRFVRRIITATGNSRVNPPSQWYSEVRYIDRYVDDTAQAFLGLRIGCARCHHHPFERYSQGDYYGLAAFFSRVDRKGGSGVAERRAGESIFVKPTGSVMNPVNGQVAMPHGLDGPELTIPAYEDPREYLVDWMVARDNPYFARAFANRMWSHFLGRGLVEPLDDMRVTNPATNEALLDALAKHFIQSKFDMREMLRLICTSSTYQLTYKANSANLDETQNHSRFYPRRLKAEVLLDAIDSATQSPTGYNGLPAGTRAIQLPDENYSNKFLTLFGRPQRESACECERIAEPSLTQSLYVMNDRFVLGKVFHGGYAVKLVGGDQTNAEKVDELFLTTLSRKPTEAETEKALEYIQSEADAKNAFGNLLWTLLSTKEFLYVH